MYEQYVILYYIVWGPPVGDATAMYAPPLRYKREALAAQDKLSGAHTQTKLSGAHTQTKLSPSSSRLKQYSIQWT